MSAGTCIKVQYIASVMETRSNRIKLPNSEELKLFARSGGYCQNPSCCKDLFITKKHNIAERAHIIAHSQAGPRGTETISETEKNSADNFLLLCPTCHEMIDSDVITYTSKILRQWRDNSIMRIEQALGIKVVTTRKEAKDYTDKILLDNKIFFELRGPMNIDSFNPESKNSQIWRKGLKTKIIPNNRSLIMFIEKNYSLLNEAERLTYSKFKLHAEELELKHIFGKKINHTQFPLEFSNIYN